MASWMRNWLVLVSLLLLGIGAWALSRPLAPPPPSREMPEERERFVELEAEMAWEGWLFQRLHRRGAFVAGLEKGLSEGRSIVLDLPENAADSVLDRLNLAVELQLEDLGVVEPAMPLGIFVVPSAQWSHPEADSNRRLDPRGIEYYLPREGEMPYCIIGVPFTPNEGEDRSPGEGDRLAWAIRYFAHVPVDTRATPNTLGLCKYFVRYGEPSPEMMAWLREGASRFAEAVPEVNHDLYFGRGPTRGPFGRPRLRYGGYSSGSLRCLSGIPDACAGIFLDPLGDPPTSGRFSLARETLQLAPLLESATSPVDFVEGYPYRGRETLGLEPFLFFAMEEHFGPERFGEFWRSPLSTEEAFEASFGEPMSRWISQWLANYYEWSPASPMIPMGALLFTLLTLGFFVGGAVHMGRR